MRTETLAIVFTDIKGYTAKTSSQSHQENAKMLQQVERLVRPVVRAFSGRVIKSIGDAFMLVFNSPTEAVRCATAIQDRLFQHNTEQAKQAADNGDKEADELHIRISVNVGEVRVHRGDVFGEPVNIAARIEGLTPADEIYVSEAIYLTMNRSEFETEQLGAYELKGIPEPVTIYRVRKQEELTEEEPPPSDDTLPEPVTIRPRGIYPYGGAGLEHWRRMRWVRPAYTAVWLLASLGFLVASVMRYQPGKDYTVVLAEIEAALARDDALDALARARIIPPTASTERERARKLRYQAVTRLLADRNVEPAAREIEKLLDEDPKDPEALFLQGEALFLRREIARGLHSLDRAAELDSKIAHRLPFVERVVESFLDAKSRDIAGRMVRQHLKERAIKPLVDLFSREDTDSNARKAIGLTLEKLGASKKVDWALVHMQDLESASCRTRKAAVARLDALKDKRAIEPLKELAESKTCGSSNAKAAIASILRKR